MSDESDFEDDLDMPQSSTPGAGSQNGEDPKRHARAQHNALERRRRDNIKDMYTSLRDEVPEMSNERASRAVILRKAIDVIQDKNDEQQVLKSEVAQLEAENEQLENEIRALQQRLNKEENEQMRMQLIRGGFDDSSNCGDDDLQEVPQKRAREY